MANVRTRGTDKVKVVSAVITLAVIVALVFGIFSVAQNVKKSKNNNLVNLNETEGNVAIKTDDDPDIPVEEPTVGDDDIINANARASMSDDGDGTEDEVTEQTKEPETEEQAVKPMTEAEVMANAISIHLTRESLYTGLSAELLRLDIIWILLCILRLLACTNAVLVW